MEEGKWGWTNYVISCTLACGSYEISLLTSMNCVNLYKFVASFPCDFRVSRTPDLLWQFREKGAAYMLVFMVLFFFFPVLSCALQCTRLCSNGARSPEATNIWPRATEIFLRAQPWMYLRKFALSRILSYDDITCFLACWLGNFFTTSLNQISSLLTLSILSKIPLITTVSSSEQFSAL